MTSSARKQAVFENNRKSMGVAYLLWLFLGAFGVHRFYAGATKSGIVQLLLALSVVGWLVLVPWLIIDLFKIPGLVREHNLKIIEALHVDEPEQAARVDREDPPAEPRPVTPADRKRAEMLEDLRRTGYRKDPRETSYLYR